MPQTAPSSTTAAAPQRQHDALATALSVAAASRDLPTIGGAAPTLIVSVREQDLDAEHGWAHAEGMEQPVSIEGRPARRLLAA